MVGFIRITTVFEITKFMPASEGLCYPHIDFSFTYFE